MHIYPCYERLDRHDVSVLKHRFTLANPPLHTGLGSLLAESSVNDPLRQSAAPYPQPSRELI